ncbi:MAG: glucokinase [Pseudomonadales bacterium]|nr:glucokinase [Pseudomonadales bacterium]
MIVGDIGGTKTQLAVIPSGNNKPELTHLKRYINAEHDCFDGILSSYLMETGTDKPTSLVLSVAGPVQQNKCLMTNLPWTLDTQHLSQAFDIPNVHLINDLAATAGSVPYLENEDFAWLQTGNNEAPAESALKETVSVLSAGTGLGEASLVYDPEKSDFVVVPGEGGHKNFAPNSLEELNLLTHYLHETPHVSIEMLVSGDGLGRIYRYLENSPDWRDAVVPSLSDADQSKNQNELITQLAFELPDSIYEHTVSLFARMLLSEASNLALQTYSNGGVVIAGGIPPKLLPFLEKRDSLAAFINKGRFSQWLSTIPVRVCLNTHAPLIGAWAYGKGQQASD